ncbi:hypothetical protein A3709_16985 [Halioglobus sp. HI00S01]|uniref:AraC family transcriptional regulator n=1 Tax=Halioglobus sp. HI00S01 TaxID=1822214 RepID=UPI0007C21CEE|nr:AraC family transcriptional regulator [Halioglobus sp. HI00S01]KZX58700.1 hypothetical protein A3709_16985 [Halioglobus sp. HI00S01]
MEPRLNHARGLLNNFEIRLMLRDLASKQDVSLHQLLDGLDLPDDLLQQPGLRLTLDQEMRLYTRAATHNRDPMLGFKVGSQLSAANYGILGYAVLGAETVDDALTLMTEFAPLISWASHNQLTTDTFADKRCRCLTLHPAANDPQAAVLEIDSTLASLQRLFNDLAGERLPFSAIQLTHPGTGVDWDWLNDWFACPIYFGAKRNALLISLDTAATLLPHPQPEYSALFRELCRESMNELVKGQGMLDNLRNMIRESEGKPPSLEWAAAQFNISARSLRRNLVATGYTYQALLDEEQFVLAQHYLLSTQLTVEAIAGTLGYSSARSFRTAFQRWTGCTPSEFRLAEQSR